VQQLFGHDADIRFQQKPADKLHYIESCQISGEKVMMLGDGLNDAGALLRSDVGIAISEKTNFFTPASDAILDADVLVSLPAILQFCKDSKKVILGSFFISLCYNFVGLFFAVQGTLQPVIAAILMPISSVSIVLFTTFISRYYAWRRGLQA